MIAILVAAATAAFVTPFPPPDLVEATPDAVRTALGKPGRVIAGAEAAAICKDACDELHVYGPDSSPKPTLTTASAFVYFKKNRVSEVKWIYPGDITKPGDYPVFGKMFEEGVAPVDATIVSHADPVTVDKVTDYARRTIEWRQGDHLWTAIVLCPLVSPYDDRVGQRKELRKGMMEEYRVALVEAGPRKPAQAPECKPGEAMKIPPGQKLPRTVKKTQIYMPPGLVATGKTTFAVAELDVDAGGKVTEVRVLRGLPGIEPNIVQNVKKWKFEPLLCGGTAIPWTGWLALKVEPGAQ